MRRAIILEGKPFDWKEGEEALSNAVSADGQVNWRAAMCADPGVTKCPHCQEYYWAEGTKLKCLDCLMEFDTYKKEQVK